MAGLTTSRTRLDHDDHTQDGTDQKTGHACTCRHRDDSVRCMKLAVCVCVVLAVISVTACGVCVRSTLLTHEEMRAYRDWKGLIDNPHLDCTHLQEVAPNVDSSEELGDNVRYQSSLPRWSELMFRRAKRAAGSDRPKKPKKRKSKKSKLKKFCNKVSRCPAHSGPDNSKTTLKASHFTVDGTTTAGQVIGALQPSKWVHANVLPAAVSSDNQVSVTESGVYLVYSTVLFNDTKFREGLVVKKNDHELFKCYDGVDHIDNTKTRKQNFKFKTCSVSGVTYLSKGDNLKMVNLYPNTNLDTGEGSTFFGLVQLIPASRRNT